MTLINFLDNTYIYILSMFSLIVQNQSPQIINMDQLSKSLEGRGYSFSKTKKGQLESGLSTTSFMVVKNNLTLMMFVMKLSPRSFVCSGYHKSRMVLERQIQFQQEITDMVDQTFNNIRSSQNSEANKIQIQIERLRSAANRAERNFKNFESFSQEMKLSEEYGQLLNYQKKVYEKIIGDTQYVIENKRKMKQKNEELLETLLKIEQNKQSLENVILAYEDQKKYLSNPKRIFEDLMSEKKRQTDELQVYALNEALFNNYIEDLIEIQNLKLKAKCLAN